MNTSTAPRHNLLRQGLAIEITLIAWNLIEGVVAITFGLLASSVALISFGIDSGIEIVSAAVLIWRLWLEFRGATNDRVEQVERRAARIAGSILLLLAVYIVVEAGRRLLGDGPEAETSLIGIVLTAASILVMPLLGWFKFRIARQLDSPALRADSIQTLACVWLSVATLAGLALNAAFGWSWADPLAALFVLPIVVREGIEGLRGKHHCC